MSTLEVKLRTVAAADSALTALLGTSPFRWYDTQLDQGSAMPAVVVLRVTYPRNYALNARMTTGQARMQFTIWGATGEQARSVEAALLTFLDGFDAIGKANLSQYPNRVVMSRAGLYAQTQPARYLVIDDVMVWNDEAVS